MRTLNWEEVYSRAMGWLEVGEKPVVQDPLRAWSSATAVISEVANLRARCLCITREDSS